MNRKLKILYSLPHPADRLGNQSAGHVVRASAILDALQGLGHEVIRTEAAAKSDTKLLVNLYRRFVRNLLPPPVAMRMRDVARIRHGKNYAQSLVEAIRVHRPDLILETHIAFSLAGKIASAETGLPLVLDDCSPAWEEEQQYGVGLKEESRRIYREVTDHARLIVAVNNTMRKYLIEEGIDAGKVLTVENGFDERLFHAHIGGRERRTQLNIPDGKVVILFVGSFQPYHKVELLIEAFNSLAHREMAHLLLVGAGKRLPESRALVTRLALSRYVTFTGRVDYQDVPSYIAAGDIAVMPATNDYGNPMKMYEYLALGKVVVAPDQPTIREIAENGRDSVLFAPEDSNSLAQKLDALIIDKEGRDGLGSNGAKLAINHTWEKRAIALQSAFRDIL